MKKIYFLMGILLLLASCKVAQKAPARVLVLPPPLPPVVYACDFKESKFQGTLLCFGNDCADDGAQLTTLDFKSDKRFTKTLETNSGQKTEHIGTWIIKDNCVLELQYDGGKMEFYKFHTDKNKLELLNSGQQSYAGNLLPLCFISKI